MKSKGWSCDAQTLADTTVHQEGGLALDSRLDQIRYEAIKKKRLPKEKGSRF